MPAARPEGQDKPSLPRRLWEEWMTSRRSAPSGAGVGRPVVTPPGIPEDLPEWDLERETPNRQRYDEELSLDSSPESTETWAMPPFQAMYEYDVNWDWKYWLGEEAADLTGKIDYIEPWSPHEWPMEYNPDWDDEDVQKYMSLDPEDETLDFYGDLIAAGYLTLCRKLGRQLMKTYVCIDEPNPELYREFYQCIDTYSMSWHDYGTKRAPLEEGEGEGEETQEYGEDQSLQEQEGAESEEDVLVYVDRRDPFTLHLARPPLLQAEISRGISSRKVIKERWHKCDLLGIQFFQCERLRQYPSELWNRYYMDTASPCYYEYARMYQCMHKYFTPREYLFERFDKYESDANSTVPSLWSKPYHDLDETRANRDAIIPERLRTRTILRFPGRETPLKASPSDNTSASNTTPTK